MSLGQAQSEDAQQFADAAVALYQDEALFTQAQQNGQQLLQKYYDKSKLQSQLIAKITAISESLAQHRQQNFTGQMLKHHTMRSTQYMAQWIEAKNK